MTIDKATLMLSVGVTVTLIVVFSPWIQGKLVRALKAFSRPFLWLFARSGIAETKLWKGPEVTREDRPTYYEELFDSLEQFEQWERNVVQDRSGEFYAKHEFFISIQHIQKYEGKIWVLWRSAIPIDGGIL